MTTGSTYTAPQSFKYIKPLEDFSAPAIDAWISQLPLSDVDGACEAIYGLLRKVNMTDGLGCLERQRIVEQIRPPTVSLLAMSSERHLPASALFPLPTSRHKHTQRSVEMCLELANAYRRVVTSGTFFSDRVMSEGGRAQTVYRALQSYGLALLRSLERYEAPPEGFWQEFYAFYRFAEGHRLHTLSLPIPEIEGATVDSQFKQILLLALSSHQHHPPDEIRQFYTTLMLIARDAEIAVSQSLRGEAALFYFDIGTDRTPRLLKRARPLTAGERRYVFTGKMLSEARQYFSNPAHRATDRFKLKPEVITSLLDALSGVEKRRFLRLPASGTRQFVVGLACVINQLSGENPLALSEAEQVLPQHVNNVETDEEEIVLGQIQEEASDSIWGKDGYPGKGDSFGYSGVAESQGAIDPASVVLTGSLLNSSAGGYCLMWLNPMVAGARVGELIGIYEDEQQIHVGVISWLHHKTRAELVIGVELLSPEVEAVTIESGLEGGGTQRGLFLYANEKLGQPASLLCGPGILRPGQNIVMRGKADEGQACRLEKLLETTLSFHLFSLADPKEGGG